MGGQRRRDATATAAAADLARWPAGTLADPNPFYGDALLGPALNHLRDRPVQLIEPSAMGEPLARLPVTAGRLHGRFRIPHCANWMHRHCFYGAPLLARGQEEQGWEALLAALDAARWSGLFLHLRGLDADGPAAAALVTVCARQGRRLDEVERHSRALLASTLDSAAYWEAHVRAKKRKELRRLQARLAEEGAVRSRFLTAADDLDEWLTAFLDLEQSGWKGEQGTALASNAPDTAFLLEACHAAWREGALDLLRLECGARTIAMLLNFIGEGGGFSFKIAIDPAFARFSPGVLVEQANLSRVLDDRVAPWMDSCAAPDHPMIDRLWGERRTIAQYRVALFKRGRPSLPGRMALPALAAVEKGYQRVKRRLRP